MEIIESIINISEGRRSEVVEHIVDSVRETAGCFLLDYTSDIDHNRSVITFIGNRTSMKKAVKELYKRAVEKIDLRNHSGEHPRIGAVDVIPFVPIRDIKLEDAIAFSHEVGQMLNDEFDVPIYMYEESQDNPARKNLADIRKGEFEGLPEKMKLVKWSPDYGDMQPHETAGASVCGVRIPLFAFNVNLGTNDIDIANSICKAIRGSSGGLVAVKALPMRLKERGIVQVSMNLVNYKKSPVFRVFEMIKSEAQRYGVPIVGSEIIGLVPQDALFEAAEFYLRFENYTPDCILERMIDRAVQTSE